MHLLWLFALAACAAEPQGTLVFGWSSDMTHGATYEITVDGRTLASVKPRRAAPAHVVVDGQSIVRQGPVQIDVAYGEHEIIVKKNGVPLWKDRIVVGGSATEWYFGLEAEPSSPAATSR